MPRPRPVLLYRGGAYFDGVPARDLYGEEVDALPVTPAELVASGLYAYAPSLSATLLARLAAMVPRTPGTRRP